MTDREKVIEELKNVQNHFESRAMMAVFGERQLFESWAQAQADAIELLKEQEPRVMPLEEVKLSEGQDVWLELSWNIVGDVMIATTIEGCGTKGVCTRYESLDYSAYGIKPYGWRCWTSRPTDEQRKATPWEPPKEG